MVDIVKTILILAGTYAQAENYAKQSIKWPDRWAYVRDLSNLVEYWEPEVHVVGTYRDREDMLWALELLRTRKATIKYV